MASRHVSLIPPRLAERLLFYAQKVEAQPQINLDALRYVQVPIFGYDDKTHTGELVVHAKLAEEVVDILLELYDTKFPIEKMRLIESYEASDDTSMADNNSSAFCYRRNVTYPDLLSKHSQGLAIDINPLYNPYVKKERVLPPEGKLYLDRTKPLKGMITEKTSCYHAFVKRGWTWGGSWPDRQDYQHFEKEI